MTYPRCKTCKRIVRTFGEQATHSGDYKHEAKLSWARRYRKTKAGESE